MKKELFRENGPHTTLTTESYPEFKIYVYRNPLHVK